LKLLSECGQYIWHHRVHLILAVPGLVVCTSVHETAHAVAVWFQGGQVLEFVWLPQSTLWGFVRYDFPPARPYSVQAIAFAPYVLWIALALAILAIAWRRKAWPFWLASSLFFWGYAVPMADTGYAALPYLLGGQNDLWSVFDAHTAWTKACIVFAIVAAVVAGFYLQRRLYGERGLSKAAYAILASLSLAGILFAARWLLVLATWGTRLIIG
jgi:hypothetical protein